MKEQEIKFLYLDGIAGNEYYIKINSVRIPVTWDEDIVISRTREILEDLNIEYPEKIMYESDGTLG